MADSIVIPRERWSPRYGRGGRRVATPHTEVIFHTEAGAIRSQDWPVFQEIAALDLSLSEKRKMQGIERYCVETRKMDGFPYSFAIFPDGSVVEGRGWGQSGWHTQGRNSQVGVCFIGHGDLQPATEAQWIGAQELIREGVRTGKLVPSPKITGHRDYASKTCPGNLIYPHIHRLRGVTHSDPHPVKEGLFMHLSEKEEREILAAARAMNLRSAQDQENNLHPERATSGSFQREVYEIAKALNLRSIQAQDHDLHPEKAPAGSVQRTTVSAFERLLAGTGA